MNKYFSKARVQRSAHGFTLIEFLVATAVGLIIMAAVGATYATSRRLNDVAMTRLSDQQDLRQVGITTIRLVFSTLSRNRASWRGKPVNLISL